MKKVFVTIVSSVIIITLILGVYFPICSSIKEKELIDYFRDKDYSDSAILNIHIENNVFYYISDYPRWWATVTFADEPGVEYQYYFNKNGKITQGTVTGGEAFYGISDKDDLINQLKHLE